MSNRTEQEIRAELAAAVDAGDADRAQALRLELQGRMFGAIPSHAATGVTPSFPIFDENV